MDFNATQNSTLTAATIAPLLSISMWIRNNIVGPISIYFLPIAVFFTIVNNSLVLVIFLTSKDVARSLTPSIRVYYIATAISDIVVWLPVHLTYIRMTYLSPIRIRCLVGSIPYVNY